MVRISIRLTSNWRHSVSEQDHRRNETNPIDRRGFVGMLRNFGTSVALSLPFLARLFGSSQALARTPVEQVTDKYGPATKIKADDKFIEDIITRERPEQGETSGRSQNPIWAAYNRFGRAYNRFGRA